jgi:O6-methylguanine-DNA--protein-cysteine methyltransferase
MNVSEKNALAIAILCHRVVRKLFGHRRGVERKYALLAREARA